MRAWTGSYAAPWTYAHVYGGSPRRPVGSSPTSSAISTIRPSSSSFIVVVPRSEEPHSYATVLFLALAPAARSNLRNSRTVYDQRNSAVSESWGVFHNIYLHTSWGVHVFDYSEGNHTCLSSLLGGIYLISSWGVIPHIMRHDKRSISLLSYHTGLPLQTGSPGSTQAAGEYFFRNMV